MKFADRDILDDVFQFVVIVPLRIVFRQREADEEEKPQRQISGIQMDTEGTGGRQDLAQPLTPNAMARNTGPGHTPLIMRFSRRMTYCLD
jgi:hypothetical protein